MLSQSKKQLTASKNWIHLPRGNGNVLDLQGLLEAYQAENYGKGRLETNWAVPRNIIQATNSLCNSNFLFNLVIQEQC